MDTETVATIVRQNGAYLVNFTGDLTQDSEDGMLYEAAGSLEKAKAVGRAGAILFGYEPHRRWRRESYGWALDAPAQEWDAG